MVPRSHRTQPHSSLQQDVEKPYFLKEHYTAAPPTSRSDQPQTIISLEQHSTPISQGVGDTGLTACLGWEGSAERSFVVQTQGVHVNTKKDMKSLQERKSGRGKNISWVESCSQPRAEWSKNSQGTDGVNMMTSRGRTLGGKCLTIEVWECTGFKV